MEAGSIMQALTAESIYKKDELQFLLSRLLAMPVEVVIPRFSDWAEEYRYIPPGVSDYYGQFDAMTAPHLIEPLNRLHPDDPCTHVAMMKSVQSMNTTTIAENAIGAYIKHKLGNILCLMPTKEAGAIRGSANIDTMIDNSELADLVKPMSNRSGRKIKDNTMYKEFSGGIKLLISSYGSIAGMKSNTWHLIIPDEWDEAGVELKDQGDIQGIIEGRTKGIRNFKILFISTPSRMETSRIYKSFMEGDQNEYFTPCPLCGEKQILILKGKGENYGLTFTREKDKKSGQKILIPETVRYTCRFCGEDFYESKKQWMLENGIWIPQAVPQDRKKHSYHSSGLIAPEVTLSWERICQDFIATDFGQDLLKFKDFTINDLGNPWAAVKKTAKWETLRGRAEDYAFGEVPEGEKRTVSDLELYTGPLLLYGGCDVQGDRLELMVTGFAVNSEKWIIDYQIFYGKTEDLNDPCWMALEDWVYNHEYKILGESAYIEMCAIDAGFNPGQKYEKRDKDYAGKANVVYEFVAPRVHKFIAVMGSPDDKAIGILKESRINETQTALTKRYMVSVSLLKEMIMNVIGNTEGHNTIHVPRHQYTEGIKMDIPDTFYQGFLSERFQEDPKKPGTFKWTKFFTRNEPLDTFNYSIAAADSQGVTRWSNDIWSRYYLELIA